MSELRELTPEQVRDIKEYDPNRWPPRIMQWAIYAVPTRLNVTYCFSYVGIKKNRVGYVQLARKYKKEYFAFMEKHGFRVPIDQYEEHL